MDDVGDLGCGQGAGLGGFGSGFNGPLQLAGTTTTPADAAAFTRLAATNADSSRVGPYDPAIGRQPR
jgi:hypothetical protein